MATIIIQYEAKCKHCWHCGSKKNAKNKRQAFCEKKNEFITLQDKACEFFKL